MKRLLISGLALALGWLTGGAYADEVPVPASVGAASVMAGCADADCCAPCAPVCGPPGRLWVRAEALLWWIEDGPVPPLVTTGPQESFGVLGQPGTTVLFGGPDAELDYDARLGGRFTAGLWLNCEQTCGLEGNFFFLGQRSASIDAASSGDPVLARPFFNVLRGEQDAELVATLLVPLTGRISISSNNRFWGAEANGICNVCCGCAYRVDVLGGFRYLRLDEGLEISEQLVVPDNAPEFAGSRLDLFDSFGTRNNFYGGQIGLRAELRRGRLLADVWGKVALGVTDQSVAINGGTTLTEPGLPPVSGRGGLLALPSNIGSYQRNEFAVVPEVGINVGYQITDRLRGLVGYTFLWWSSVARPGDQIDLGVNETQLPPGTLEGPARPAFTFNDTSFWAQGLSLGLEFRY